MAGLLCVMNPLHAACALVTVGAVIGCSSDKSSKQVMDHNTELPEANEAKVVKTDEEWKKLLSPEQYHILREAGTEAPYGDAYRAFKEQGVGQYLCAGCGALLFSSNEKFDSGCGWPSFYDPAAAQNVQTRRDESLGMVRIEVTCAQCDGHLGHVFEGEGYDTPTDLRYCINGVGLEFVPAAQNP